MDNTTRAWISELVGRTIGGPSELTPDEVDQLCQLAHSRAHPTAEVALKVAEDEWGALGVVHKLLDGMDRDAAWSVIDGAQRLVGERPTDEEGPQAGEVGVMPDPEAARGIDVLMRQLGTLMLESVYLRWQWNQGRTEWEVWTGAPTMDDRSGGSRWGSGDTAQRAIADAYQQVMAAIFAGRVRR